MSKIKLEINGKVASLTIDRADKHNALTQAMWQSISDYCDQLMEDKSVRVLVITGAGSKAFSAGADIEELHEIIQDPVRLKNNNEIVQLAQQKLAALPFASIAKINGVCVGGGLGIALTCDFRIATNTTRLAITPAKLGLLYSIEDTARLLNIVGLANAKELLYLGKKIDAQTALDWGLITRLVPTEKLESSVEEMVTMLTHVSGYSVKGIKQTLVYLTQASNIAESDVRRLFDQAFSEKDFNEGAHAFLEKRKAEF